MENPMDFWRYEWNRVADTTAATSLERLFGKADDENGYYDANGNYLGTNDNDGKVYFATKKISEKDETGAIIEKYDNPIDLGITHHDFKVMANVIYQESSGNKTESLWIAHTANNAKDNNAIDWRKKNTTLYDQLTCTEYIKAPAAKNKTTLSETIKTIKAKNARRAIISVLLQEKDPTNGSVLWDGIDFLEKKLEHNKFTEYKKITIPNSILKKFCDACGKECPDVFLTQNNQDFEKDGKGKYHSIVATGSYGKTIFWKLDV